MDEAGSGQEATYRRALERYKQGAWNEVIDLLVDVDEKSDDMRSLLAAARWQVALARAKQKSGAKTEAAPDVQGAQPTLRRRLSSWATRGLVAANLLTYGVLISAVLVIWQSGGLPSLTVFHDAATPSQKQSLLNRAETAIAAKDWDSAIRSLETLLANQPDNVEAQDRLAFAREQRRLESLFAQAQGYYSRQRWDEALASFQALQTSAPDFRADQVAGYVCQTYIKKVRSQIVEAQNDIEQLLPLQAKLKEYADECGRDDAFAVERELLGLYVAGLEAAQLGQWTEAIGFFLQIRESRPDYAAGQAARRLYAAHVNKGQDLAGQGRWSEALNEYNAALALGVPDVMGAIDLRMGAVATLSAPTLTPTPEPTAVLVRAMSTLSPTPVTPTPTVNTPSPTPMTIPSATPTTSTGGVIVSQPRPTATPSPTPIPTSTSIPWSPPPEAEPPTPPPPPPTATPVPPTNTPAPTNTPLPPTATPTATEQRRPSTPTPPPPEQERPPTPTPARGG